MFVGVGGRDLVLLKFLNSKIAFPQGLHPNDGHSHTVAIASGYLPNFPKLPNGLVRVCGCLLCEQI